MDNDRIWNLIAKKLAGEASAGELKELESVLRLDPDLHYSLEALHDMWKKQSEEDAASVLKSLFKDIWTECVPTALIWEIRRRMYTLDEFPDSPSRFQKWKILAFLSPDSYCYFLDTTF